MYWQWKEKKGKTCRKRNIHSSHTEKDVRRAVFLFFVLSNDKSSFYRSKTVERHLFLLFSLRPLFILYLSSQFKCIVLLLFLFYFFISIYFICFHVNVMIYLYLICACRHRFNNRIARMKMFCVHFAPLRCGGLQTTQQAQLQENYMPFAVVKLKSQSMPSKNIDCHDLIASVRRVHEKCFFFRNLLTC